MLGGRHSFPRVRRSIALAALITVGLTGCSLASASSSGSSRGDEAPVAAQSAARSSVKSLTPASGRLRGGTAVTVTGTGLSAVRSAEVNGTVIGVTKRSDRSVTFSTPPSKDFAAGKQSIQLRGRDSGTVATTAFTYKAVDGADLQLQYVLSYWKHYNPAYEALHDNDCVDFTSQALLLRGWKQQDDWTHADDVVASGAAWRSSTSFHDFMEQHPELGTELTDDERDRVSVGDIVQFDWDRSGDRDHTGTVTKIVQENGKVRIYFAGHTNDSNYRSVDSAITKDHPGGVAYYWHLK